MRVQIFTALNASGKAKSLPATTAASIAAAMPLELVLPFIKASGYTFKVLAFSPNQIKLFILHHEKGKVQQSFNAEVKLTAQGCSWFASDNRISNSAASKLASSIPALLFKYPLGLLVERGFYPKEALIPTLALVLENTARKSGSKISSEDAGAVAEAMVELMGQSRLYKSASPSQLANYLEAKIQATPALEGAE